MTAATATYTITAPIWRYEGPAGWHFVTLPTEVADEIDVRFEHAHRPFGSLRVHVSLGHVSWTTSLFRDTKSESYLLPIKAVIRRVAGVDAGDTVTLELTVDV